MKAILSVVIAAGLLTGCSTTGRKVDQAHVDMIRVGDTKQDVEARIGPPDQVGKSLTGETWIYAYNRSRPNAKRFIPLFGTFIGGKNVESQTITVAFDQTGRVADVHSAYGGTNAQGQPASTTGPHTTTSP